MSPDHERDVVVHQFTALDALTGEMVGDRWSVWAGRESQGSFENEAEALDAARMLGEECGAPVWLLRTGEPPEHLP
jgi:hypothetical protein